MGNRARLAGVALFGGLAVLGLALGAESQREIFLEPDPEEQDSDLNSGAAGNLVVLTATVVALGGAGAAALLSRLRPWEKAKAAGGLFVGLYAAILLAQSASPNYNAIPALLFAELYTSLAAPNFPGAPSVVVPILAVTLAAVGLCLVMLKRLLGTRTPKPGSHDEAPHDVLKAQVSAVLLAVPFLALAAWGNLRILLGLPNDQPGLGPYLVVLPLMAFACLALIALGLAKCWRLGSYVQNGRLAAAVQESWQALGRAELAAAGALGALALIASVLSAADLPDLALRRTFGVTLRAHSQFLLLLAIPWLPVYRMQRRGLLHLQAAPLHHATLESGTHNLAKATVVAVTASVGLAALATWAIQGVLWAWLLAFAPVALLAAVRLGSDRSAPHVLLLAFILWAIGNTVRASFFGTSATLLQFDDAPGVLALWRTLAAAVAGVAGSRLVLRLARGEPSSRALPLSIGAGACLAAVALLEMPLAAWLIPSGNQAAIAVGSVVASQEPGVRILLHSVAGLLGVAAAMLVARLHRPEWFRAPPPPPLPAPIRVKATRPPRPAAKSSASGQQPQAPGAGPTGA